MQTKMARGMHKKAYVPTIEETPTSTTTTTHSRLEVKTHVEAGLRLQMAMD
jgi:hypothetical protein